MKQQIFLTLKNLLFAVPLMVSYNVKSKDKAVATNQSLYFVEQKGQFADLDSLLLKNVDYVVNANGFRLLIGKGKLTYCFKESKIEVQLVNANLNPKIVAEDPAHYYENFYLPNKDLIKASSFRRIVYKDVYPGIDWAFYSVNGKLEHEFYVSEGADPNQIQLSYAGNQTIHIDKNKGVVISGKEAVIFDSKPICFTNKGLPVKAKYKIEGNKLSYTIDKYEGGLVIDPSIQWSTYYGTDTSTRSTYIFSQCTDPNGNVYICGHTNAYDAISTTGSWQENRTSNASLAGATNAYLAKFDSTGKRLWATYYGGNRATETAYTVVCDASGNVYLGGRTQSNSGIATVGTDKTVFTGDTSTSSDGFIVKFNSSGVRQWATYCGGDKSEDLWMLACDDYGHIYATGRTYSTNNIATSGAHKSILGGTNDAFLMKYATADGKRIWGTYYGGTGAEGDARVSVGGVNIFLGGSTISDTGIATSGTHQTTLGSVNGDTYLAAFDSSGKRLWGSYFGGENNEIFGGISGVQEGAIYLSGTTQSLTNIASTGADKTVLSGYDDAFLAKFKTDGTLEWATYVGGEQYESAGDRIARDQLGNVFLYGLTASITGISSSYAWQKIYGGGKTDHFISCFDPSGKKIWASYMGGEGEEGNLYRISGCSYSNNALYISGTTKSYTGIATPSSFKPAFGGAIGGFLTRIKEPIPTTGSIAPKSEIGQSMLTVYPNPGSGIFTLSLQCSNYNGIVEIQILNMAGKVIQRMENQMLQGSLTKEIKLFDSLPQGVYLVNTIIEGKMNTQRIIKR